MPHKRVCQPTNGTFCTSKCAFNSRKLNKGGVHKVHSTCVKTSHADPRTDTNFIDIYAKNGTLA